MRTEAFPIPQTSSLHLVLVMEVPNAIVRYVFKFDSTQRRTLLHSETGYPPTNFLTLFFILVSIEPWRLSITSPYTLVTIIFVYMIIDRDGGQKMIPPDLVGEIDLIVFVLFFRDKRSYSQGTQRLT